MGASAIFYILSVMLSLYCVYLVTFRTYRMEYSLETHKDEPTDERIVYPRAVYLLLIALCFVPITNVVLSLVLMAVSVDGRRAGEFYVKSWLFEKPEKKKEEGA
jgi:hypothetical protein